MIGLTMPKSHAPLSDLQKILLVNGGPAHALRKARKNESLGGKGKPTKTTKKQRAAAEKG